MQFQQKGIILITVLIFLFIFSLLAITSISNSTLQVRMANNFVTYNEFQQALEAGLLEGTKQLLADLKAPQCIINEPSPDELSQPWLLGKSCTLRYNNQLIYYTIQRLYPDICLVTGIGKNKEALLAEGDIYQITAWIEQSQQPGMVLQTTYAKTRVKSCVNPIIEIKPGLLSWREISN